MLLEPSPPVLVGGGVALLAATAVAPDVGKTTAGGPLSGVRRLPVRSWPPWDGLFLRADGPPLRLDGQEANQAEGGAQQQ